MLLGVWSSSFANNDYDSKHSNKINVALSCIIVWEVGGLTKKVLMQ